MTVYVDTMQANYRRYVMCHCWADTRDELFTMMTTIGVQLKRFQRPANVPIQGMNASWEHFDISMSKKKLAIKHGAVEVDMYMMAVHANWQQFLAAETPERMARELRSCLNAYNLIERRKND